MVFPKSKGFKPQFDAVECFCFDKNGNLILLQKRKDHKLYPGRWGIPAGRVESDENPFDAIAREIQEETGNNVPRDMLKLAFETNHKHIIKRGEGESVLCFRLYTFISEMRLKMIVLDRKEHEAYGTIKPKHLPSLERKLIPDTLAIYNSLKILRKV